METNRAFSQFHRLAQCILLSKINFYTGFENCQLILKIIEQI